jgi:hypothetical protein
MKRPSRNKEGVYIIHGKTYKELFGSREQVWNKNAYKTTGELTIDKLMMNSWGRIVSRSKHLTSKREKRLQKRGYKGRTRRNTKGQFLKL